MAAVLAAALAALAAGAAGAGARAPVEVAARAPTVAEMDSVWLGAPAGTTPHRCPVFLILENMEPERRVLLRKTWLGAAADVLGPGCFRIFTAVPGEVSAETAAEVDKYGDLVVFPNEKTGTIKSMAAMTKRHTLIFQWMVTHIVADHVVKVDDDVYTCLPRVFDILSRAPRERLLWGRPMVEDSCEVFMGHTMHPDPNFLAVSWDLARQIQRQQTKLILAPRRPIDHVVGTMLQGTLASYHWDASRMFHGHKMSWAFETGVCARMVHAHRARGKELEDVWKQDQELGTWKAIPNDPIGQDPLCPLVSWYPVSLDSHTLVVTVNDMLASDQRQFSLEHLPKGGQNVDVPDRLPRHERLFLAIASTATPDGHRRRAELRAVMEEQCAGDAKAQCDLTDVVFFVRNADPAALAGEHDVVIVQDDGQVVDGVDDERVLPVWRWALENGKPKMHQWFALAQDDQFVALPRLRIAAAMYGEAIKHREQPQYAVLGPVGSCEIDLDRLTGPTPRTDFVVVSAEVAREVIYTWPPKVTTSLARLMVMSLTDIMWSMLEDERILGETKHDCTLVAATRGGAGDITAAHKADQACMDRLFGGRSWRPFMRDTSEPYRRDLVCQTGFWAIPSVTHAGEPVTIESLKMVFDDTPAKAKRHRNK